MTSKTDISTTGVVLLICILIIGALGYYSWNLNQKVSELETFQSDTSTQENTGLLAPQQNDNQNNKSTPWPEDWDPWSDNWDPSGQFAELQKRMDEMMNMMSPGHSIFSHRGFGLSQASVKISMDETDNEYTVVVTVPDGQEVELNAELNSNILKISGKTKSTSEKNNGQNKIISTSQFSQSMTLAAPVNESAMTIEHKEKKIIIKVPKKN